MNELSAGQSARSHCTLNAVDGRLDHVEVSRRLRSRRRRDADSICGGQHDHAMPETTKSDAHINAPSELAAIGNPYTNFRGARRDRDFRNWPDSEATADGRDGGLLGAMQRTTTCNDRPKTGRWVALRWRCDGRQVCPEQAARRTLPVLKFGLDGQPAISVRRWVALETALRRAGKKPPPRSPAQLRFPGAVRIVFNIPRLCCPETRDGTVSAPGIG